MTQDTEAVAIGIDGSRRVYVRNADGSWPAVPTRIEAVRFTPLGMSGGVPAGWVLVPRELTPAMLDATCATEEDDKAMRSAWAELLAATPTPPIEGRDADVERVDMQVITDAVRYAKQVLAQVYTRKDRKMTSVASSNVNTAAHRLAAALQALGERG